MGRAEGRSDPADLTPCPTNVGPSGAVHYSGTMPCFAAGLFFAFGDEHVEAGDDLAPGCVGGVDDFVDVATFGSDVRIGVLLDVLVDKFVLASGAFCVGAKFR